MSGSILFRAPLASTAPTTEPDHLARKDYVDQSVGQRLLIGGAASDYLSKQAVTIPQSTEYDVLTLPVGQKTVVGSGNLNLPPGDDPYYYMEANRGDTAVTVYLTAVGVNTGHTWRRAWNGSGWTNWSRPLMLSEYVAGDATNKLDKTAGGNVTGYVNFRGGLATRQGAPDTQAILTSYGWNTDADRWAHVLESNADFALYSYGPAGEGPERNAVIRRFADSSDLLRYRLFEVYGGIRSSGTHAAMVVEARNNPDHSWHMYADTANSLRFWCQTANADMISCDLTGNFMVAGALHGGSRIYTGWDSGWAGSISCSNWFRVLGNAGLLFSTWGGGFYMSDSTYIRTFGDKAIAASHFVSTGAMNPQYITEQSAFYAQGNYGGGYGMGDGAYRLAYYSQSGNHMFGCGLEGTQGYVVASIGRDGVISASDYALNSDATMKEEVKPLMHRARLQPVTYKLLPEYSLRETPVTEIGFIADDVERTHPEVVSRDQNGKLQLSYSRITAINTAHINHVEDQVTVLKTEVSELRKELQELRSLIRLQQTG